MTDLILPPSVRKLQALPGPVRARRLAELEPAHRARLALVLESVESEFSVYRDDPVAFVEDHLGETTWSLQRDILRSVRDNRRTAVPACHAPGKSHTAARIVAWWSVIHPPGTAMTVTTATTFRQVKNILWPHIRRVARKHDLPGAKEMSLVEWKIDGELSAFGFSAADNDESAVQGIHAPNFLIVVDEAGGIGTKLGGAMEALMTGGNTRMLLIGNPSTEEEDTWFEKCCTSPLFNVIRIPADATPNFTGEDVGMCQSCPPTVPDHPLSDHLVDQRWVDEVVDAFGPESPFVEARVHARFPTHVANRVMPFSWVEQAVENDDPDEADWIKYGVDIAAGGGDEMVIAKIDGWTAEVVHAVAGSANRNAVDVAGVILRHIREGEREAKERNLKPPRVKVDATGVGWGVVSLLETWGAEGKHGCEIVGVHVGGKASESERFVNQRAEMWWMGRELVQPVPRPDGDGRRQRVRLNIERITIAQFAGPLYSTDTSGRIVIEKKTQMKSRGVRSPDRAEAILLGLYEPPMSQTPELQIPINLGQTNVWGGM